MMTSFPPLAKFLADFGGCSEAHFGSSFASLPIEALDGSFGSVALEGTSFMSYALIAELLLSLMS
jgi:hypothetical protein